MTTPVELTRLLASALPPAGGAGSGAPRVVVERTRPGGVGEYACGVALRAAGPLRARPEALAGELRERLRDTPGLREVVVTGPGFLNFSLDWELLAPRLIDAAGPYAPPGPARTWDAAADNPRAAVVADALGGLTAPRVVPVADPRALVARHGLGAVRWAMLAAPPERPARFGPELIRQDESSELFTVRHAHHRARALLRAAARLDITPEYGGALGGHPADPARPLLAALADDGLAREAAAHHRAPDRLLRQLGRLADALIDLSYRALPLGDEKPSAAHRSRLALAEAAGTVLAGGLTRIGVDAPDFL
ncbi:DALR anticodon-binding domain-containing protein [Streptomyces sp. BI20]|uniref:DALR anticodon-binding domain-containing protein n=1 Tax=Streptomyces sp. BI20 TaxID=3403460 RepID=UPI003C77F448